MTQEEKGFWHKTKELTGNLWDGTKEVTEDVWEGTKNVTEDIWDGTKNVAGSVKNVFSSNDDDAEIAEFTEEIDYTADDFDDDMSENRQREKELRSAQHAARSH